MNVLPFPAGMSMDALLRSAERVDAQVADEPVEVVFRTVYLSREETAGDIARAGTRPPPAEPR
jgi:hypothetical protein